MKVLVQRLSTSPQYARVLEWGKLVTITGGAQAFVQALGLIGGILVIRLLPTREYALYTLANTMLGAMIILADGGISAGVLAQGGKVWNDKQKLGVVLVTGLDLRRKFAIGSLLLAAPVLLYLLRSHGASWLTAGLIIVCLVPAFITALSGTLLEVAPKLRQDIAPLQKIQVGANLGRLSMLALTLFTFPLAFVAVLASGLSQIWANRELRKISVSYADWNQKTDPAVRREILAFVKRILPGSIYYCLSGQITTWLISFFGTTTAVAQVGALGRLAMMLSLFSVLFNTLVLPRFARLPDKINLLLSRYLQIQALLIIISVSIIGIVWLFPSEILWVLGKDYANLESAVVLNIINSCLGLIAGASFSICTSRGWAIHPLISIPVTIVAIICGVFLFNISSLLGILTLNIFVSSIEVIMYVVYSLLNITKIRLQNSY
ncbi:MATE family efflux transporter [Hymenobacter crusticola]|uniref:Polysaccharide biosynthesis protein n=1 Tax=Hymenobacter crusticola TaxID=1770526 RepID=A0A243W8K7_9BACT|nr:polysaccharide biosynthesis protein [Hymenobacter crusticola]OUJ71253.1 polysaccharide biosynthesis protein [Hymenobacter crusticola]